MLVTARAFRTPGSKIWTVEVTGEGVDEVTQALHLAEVEDMARSVVALTKEVPEESVTVTVEVPEADKAQKAWREAMEAEENARRTVTEAADRAKATAREARAAFGVGDAAFVLGLSKQRISQLTKN